MSFIRTRTSYSYWLKMEYLGDKLSVAHSQVSGWMGNVRRSLQGALNLVSSSVERRSGGGGEDGVGFKRAGSLRSLASRSRDSFRRFSLRSQQRLSMRRRTTSLASPSTPSSVRLPIFSFSFSLYSSFHYPTSSSLKAFISPTTNTKLCIYWVPLWHHVDTNLCVGDHFLCRQNCLWVFFCHLLLTFLLNLKLRLLLWLFSVKGWEFKMLRDFIIAWKLQGGVFD